MDLRDLKMFLHLAESRHFGRSARAMHVGQWRITEGTYQVALGPAADSLGPAAKTVLQGAHFGS